MNTTSASALALVGFFTLSANFTSGKFKRKKLESMSVTIKSNSILLMLRLRNVSSILNYLIMLLMMVSSVQGFKALPQCIFEVGRMFINSWKEAVQISWI